VLQESDEVTGGVDLTPSPNPEEIERLAGALVCLDAAPRYGATLADAAADPEDVPVLGYDTSASEVKAWCAPPAPAAMRIFAEGAASARR
jgi:hypothetical protein